MFTEQPAPPAVAAEVQIQPTDATAPKAAPAAINKVSSPEAIAPAPPAPPPVTPDPAASAGASSSTADAAKAQRRQEVEQALLELTNKARAKQKEQQQQQAATEAAKYSEAGDFDQAQQAANHPLLSAKDRAALLRKLQAKKAKQDAIAARKGTLTAKAKLARKGNGTSAPQFGNAGVSNATEYTATPIVSLSQAQMRLRFGKLFGRNLDFAFPLTIPVPITSAFGWRMHPISGTPRFHRGIDLGADLGSPIVAVKTGRVETSGLMDGYGLTVVLRHTAAQQTLYAHLSQVFVRPGEQVKKGQLLGLVGSTGNSTGPHLHFELHQLTSDGWVALDPAIALDAAIALAQSPLDALSSGVGLHASRKPQPFNLALSGLLDVNAPDSIAPSIPFIHTTLAQLLAPSSLQPQQTGLPLPLTFLPSLNPVSWLSPLVDQFLAEQSLPLPEVETPPVVTFNSVPALAATDTFNPNSVLPPTPTSAQLATTKPLAGLTIAEQVPGAVRLAAFNPSKKVLRTEN